MDECKGAMECSATSKTCKCPSSTQDWCPAFAAGSGDCLTVNGVGPADTCICNFECKGDMGCGGGKCICNFGSFCVARDSCRMPVIAGDLAEGAECCPDSGWVDECAGAMTCSTITKTCTCPSGYRWCTASNACVVENPVPASRLAAGATCCWSTQCKGDMTCLANNKCGCATGE